MQLALFVPLFIGLVLAHLLSEIRRVRRVFLSGGVLGVAQQHIFNGLEVRFHRLGI
jgi:uncharacterized membrane protein affecting hemolysin expression